MCSGLAVGFGFMAASTLMQGAAAKARGEAAKKADYQSAEGTDRAAAEAVERGNLKELQETMRGSSILSHALVIQSGSGTDVTMGASLATRKASEAVLEIDRTTVRRNAALEAYGLRERSRAYRQHGENAEAEGNAAMWGTFLGGAAKVIGAAGKIGTDLSLSGTTEMSSDDVLREEH